MAKTIMVADKVYEDLKELKTRENKSYSEVLRELLKKKELKTGAGLMKHLGVLKGDKEYDEIMKELRKEWKKWSERYA